MKYYHVLGYNISAILNKVSFNVNKYSTQSYIGSIEQKSAYVDFFIDTSDNRSLLHNNKKAASFFYKNKKLISKYYYLLNRRLFDITDSKTWRKYVKLLAFA